MPRRFLRARAVLFDWDGTLLNSYDSDARAYLAMFRAMGIDWTVEDLERHYSPDWYRVFRAAGLPRSKWDLADRLWRRAYRKESPRLLPNARRVLRALDRSFVLALVTSGSRRRVRRQLREFELADYFAACVCSEDAPRRKPDPAPLRMALGRLRLEPGKCVYVGDAPEDIEMARRARVRVVGVRGPFPTAERVRAAKPDAFLDSIAELPGCLSALSNSLKLG
jgi:HAD superfamily hydrolase (TIGR01509 family)